MRKKGEKYASLVLNGEEWVFNRSNAGETISGQEKDEDSLLGIRRMPFGGKETTEIIVVMDGFSLEIFEDGKALSSTVYPELDADGIYLSVDADECVYVREDI